MNAIVRHAGIYTVRYRTLLKTQKGKYRWLRRLCRTIGHTDLDGEILSMPAFFFQNPAGYTVKKKGRVCSDQIPQSFGREDYEKATDPS